MSTQTPDGGRGSRPPYFSRAFGELAVVLGLCLVTIFLIIPNQTSSGDEIGLSPSLVPTVCAIIIAVLAALQFAVHVMAGGGADETALPSIHFSFILIAITGAGLTAFRFVNAETGCSLLALSAFLFMGERRPLALVSMAGAVATIIFLVQELGI